VQQINMPLYIFYERPRGVSLNECANANNKYVSQLVVKRGRWMCH
jgi:hypothetical protein